MRRRDVKIGTRVRVPKKNRDGRVIQIRQGSLFPVVVRLDARGKLRGLSDYFCCLPCMYDEIVARKKRGE